MKRLTRMPRCCRSATTSRISAAGVDAGHPAWLVISPGRTGTSVHWWGRTSRTIASRSGRGSPSMLNSTLSRCGARNEAIAGTSQRVMCRSSARGWIVMPGAPAATHTRTASTTDGTAPPREFRSVATLLTFTESRGPAIFNARGAPPPLAAARLASLARRGRRRSALLDHRPAPIGHRPSTLVHRLPHALLHRLGNLPGPALNLLLVASFDHDAQQRFSPRVPDQETALPREPPLDALHRVGDLGHGSQLLPLAHAHVHEHLWVRDELRREIGELPPGVGHHPQHVERGRDAVAGEEMLGEDDVARLLAAERETASDHLLHDVLVADRTPNQVDPRLAQRELEADVAHDGRHDGVAAETTLRLHVPRAHQHDRVTVDDSAGVIDEDGAVAVAVERHAHPAPVLPHRRGEPLRMRGSAIEVDVPAVGLVADDRDVVAQLAKQPRRHGGRRAVRRVDGHLEAAEAGGIGKREPRVCQVGVDDVGPVDRREAGSGYLPAGVADDRLDLPLERLGELFTAAREDLDAVVLEGIVRCADDQPRVEAERAGDVRDGRRRDHASGRYRRALCVHAASELALDPVPRLARVAADDEPKIAISSPAGSHRPDECRAQAGHGLVIERVGAGLAADAISTEKAVRRHVENRTVSVLGVLMVRQVLRVLVLQVLGC